MVVTALEILLCIGCMIFFIIGGIVFTRDSPWGRLGAGFFFGMLFPLALGLGLAIYFLAIVYKLYGELAKGIISGQQRGVVLQPHGTPQMVQAGGGVPTVATVYVPPGAQTATYQYPQQAPTAVQGAAYQYAQQTPDSPFMQHGHPQQAPPSPYMQQQGPQQTPPMSPYPPPYQPYAPEMKNPA